MNWKLVLVIRFTLFTACSALKAKSRNYAMEKQKIIVSNETLISITTVFSDIACAQQCLCTATCCSASYKIETKKCLLNSCCNPEIQPSENGIFIQKTVSDNSPYVCIQGNNKNLDLQYRFDDGLEMTFFNWDELQPQYPTTDHYIILRKSTSYKWHDVPNERSDLKCTFICEK
ncbi:CLEC3A [Mytilus coruscus]|uniref:CLEC3A n=1 Tax=Mytilus coruscus TaxID=42192 RepID=A0A6J8BJ47_MYTCO|nr:CLEC3A [Mytilus coruscus]